MSTKSLQAKLGDLQRAILEQKFTFNPKLNGIYADFVNNSVLPIVWVKEDQSIIYSNKSMDELIGCRVCDRMVSYYANKEDYSKIAQRLESDDKVNGLPVTLKRCDGQTIQCKVYSNVHRDEGGNWINTRCTFVPY